MSKLKIRKRRGQGPAGPASKPPAVPTDLMTIRDIMAFAKVSDATVRRWIRAKLLPSYKAGGQVRIDKSELIKFLQG